MLLGTISVLKFEPGLQNSAGLETARDTSSCTKDLNYTPLIFVEVNSHPVGLQWPVCRIALMLPTFPSILRGRGREVFFQFSARARHSGKQHRDSAKLLAAHVLTMGKSS